MRQKLTTPMLASIGAMGLVGALFLSFYLSTGAFRSGGTGIVLPTEAQENLLNDAVEVTPNLHLAEQIQVTPKNVQQMIATLQRPAAYRYVVKSIVYADDLNRSTVYRQSAKQGVCRTDTLNAAGGTVNTVLRSGDTIYAWSAGETAYYTGKNGDFSDDDTAALPTYETVLALPTESIAAAQLVNVQYEPCIRVAVTEEGYRMLYDISTISGLLYHAEIYEGDVLVRTCQMEQISMTASDDALFVLPDGNALLGE